MKKTIILSVVILFALSLLSQSVPNLIDYQGGITDENGNYVNGEESIVFSIYGVETGGTALWTETQSVHVFNGLFHVLLGSVNPLPDNLFDEPNRWISINVDGYGEMEPRGRIASVGLAANADKLDGLDATEIESNAVPSGCILLWYGSIATIPDGWVLCDGNNGTPDLRDRFIVGAGNEYAINNIGGENEHTLTISEMPSHSHSNYNYIWHGESDGLSGAYKSREPSTTGSVGGSQPHENRPPYYALAYIMKQ